MELDEFFRQSRVVVVAGKGGVGKTTVTAALARAAASEGLSVLVVALDATGALPALFGRSEVFGYDEVLVDEPGSSGSIRSRVITPDEALLEYLQEHGMRRISKRLVSSGALDVVATAIPGIREILVLGKVKSLEMQPAADLIVIDAPAAGHAVSFLTSALGLLDASRGGPVRVQAQDVVDLLTDASRCQVLLVTIPEETPVNELVETAYRLEDEVGVKLGPIIVNGCYPVLDLLAAEPVAAAAAAGVEGVTEVEAGRLARGAVFRRGRQAVQAEQLSRLAEQLPLPQVRLPYLFTADVGPAEIDTLASALAEGARALPVPAASPAPPAPAAAQGAEAPDA